MRTRVVLFADPDTVLTNGTDYGTIIWLADGVSPDGYYSIPKAEYDAIMAQEATACCID